MKLVYAKLRGGNFGDDLNPWLWRRLLPGVLNDDASEVFIGIGSILSSDLNGPGRKIVLGTGTGYGKPPAIDESWHIYCVRGPLTARRLGLGSEKGCLDAAYLLRRLGLVDPPTKRAEALFIPHHASIPDVDWAALCERAGLRYLDSTSSVEACLDAILSSKLVIAEAMHGAIVADAFRIPWVPVRYGYRSLDFKWHDWCNSLGMVYEPVDLPNLLQAKLGAPELTGRFVRRAAAAIGLGKEKWRRAPVLTSDERELRIASELLQDLAGGARATLSPHVAFRDALERLEASFDELLADLSAGVFPSAGALDAGDQQRHARAA